MGQIYSSYHHYNCKELQQKIENKSDFILLNTLPLQEQKYLIKGTIIAIQENSFINSLKNKSKEIVIYGKNHHDLSVIEKYNKLKKIGFNNIYIYFGGLFEWALLQEIYGISNFQTDGSIDEPLKLL
jgi:rhodanese-related sulfurtransferase